MIDSSAGLLHFSIRMKRSAAATIIFLLVSGGTARTEQVLHLTAVDSYAPNALWVRVFIEYYIPEVDRRLTESGNYRIKWNKAFAGTIAKTKGVLEALQYDLADIGIVTTPYHPDKVPFYNISYAGESTACSLPLGQGVIIC